MSCTPYAGLGISLAKAMSAPLHPMDPNPVLEHLDWVRALARKLVQDGAAADDLVQEAWLRTRRSPPNPIASPRAWLGQVVRNLARERQRGEVRRRERERSTARDEALPSNAELHEHLETQQRIGRCVMNLDEPYRRTVLLRYYEDTGPREIAQLEGVPLNTVKARLRRAHERLAMSLDREHGGDGRAWLLALVPVARAEPIALPGAVFSAVGGVLMIHAKKLALVFVPLLLLLWTGSRVLESEQSEVGVTQTRSVDLAETAQSDNGSVLAIARTVRERQRVAQAGSATGKALLFTERLDVHVVRAGSGESVASARVRSIDLRSIDTDLLVLNSVFDPDLFDEHGVEHFADENGRLTIPWSGDGVFLEGAARSGSS